MDSKLKESILCEFWHLKPQLCARDEMDIRDTLSQGFLYLSLWARLML